MPFLRFKDARIDLGILHNNEYWGKYVIKILKKKIIEKIDMDINPEAEKVFYNAG